MGEVANQKWAWQKVILAILARGSQVSPTNPQKHPLNVYLNYVSFNFKLYYYYPRWGWSGWVEMIMIKANSVQLDQPMETELGNIRTQSYRYILRRDSSHTIFCTAFCDSPLIKKLHFTKPFSWPTISLNPPLWKAALAKLKITRWQNKLGLSCAELRSAQICHPIS